MTLSSTFVAVAWDIDAGWAVVGHPWVDDPAGCRRDARERGGHVYQLSATGARAVRRWVNVDAVGAEPPKRIRLSPAARAELLACFLG